MLDNAAFEAEQMGKSLTVNSARAVAAVRQPERPESARWKTLFVGCSALFLHTKIEVGFAVDKDGITITVDGDDGPGKQLRKIAKQISVCRSPMKHAIESGGTGLGCYCCSAIQQHRAKEDSPLSALRLVIWLPLYKRS